jgi:hypothetical protein
MTGDHDGASGGGQMNMENILGALALYMEHHRANSGGHEATKALKGVVDKIGRFDGKNITNFLRVYVCEMEVHQVSEDRMMLTFDLAVVPEIRERVQEIREDVYVTSWATFDERLRDEYFDEDTERMTKRSFLDWVEQQPGNDMGPNELLREFEKKYNQLPLAERRLLDTRKAEMFLQAADDALEDRLLLLLGDRTTEGGFTNDWRRVEETVTLVAKQRRVRSRGIISRTDANPMMVPRAPKLSLAPTTLGETSKTSKRVEEDSIEELIKGIRDLRVEMSELKKARGASSSQSSDGAKSFVKRCIWCDVIDHTLRGCTDYDGALKEGIVSFKDGRIRDASTDLPMDTNFGKGGMKKIMDEKRGKSSALRAKGVESYHIEVDHHTIEASSTPAREIMIRGAQAIRKATGWEDPVDAVSIKAFLGEVQNDIENHDASVEVKRGRPAEEDDADEPTLKKKNQGLKEAAKGDGPGFHTRQRPEKSPSINHPGDAPLPEKIWEDSSTSKKGKEKEDSGKGKTKGPAYKLQSDIETSIDMKGILEERILDAKIEFTLREALGIAKKDFHDLIIDVIKRKRQMTAETVMMHALDTHMTEDEEIEIGQVFNMMCDAKGDEEKIMNMNIEALEEQKDQTEEMKDYLTDEEEDDILKMFAAECMIDIKRDVTKTEHSIEGLSMKGYELMEVKSSNKEAHSILTQDEGKEMVDGMTTEVAYEERFEVEANVFDCGIVDEIDRERGGKLNYYQPFWARATTETRVRLGELDDSILALVDHGSEINIMSRRIYEKGKWPIDTHHGWVMRAANNGRGELYGACPAVCAKIGDVEVEQNFFVQNYGTYPIILGQPYITAARMETKVLDDGSHYARIRSRDGKRSLQFLTVRPDHERNRIQLRDAPLRSGEDFQDF